MHLIDWIVLAGTLATIVGYGVWKTKSVKNTESFLLGDRQLKWWTIGLSIMATQASAITFLSTPGKAYQDGMGFAQFYFGLPIAMVFLAAFVLPHFYRLKVYTAYEFLEGRFDRRTRQLTAFFFLLQRGLAAGLTIFAPAIILSSILGWDLQITNLFIGVVVIFYTVMGGTNAVSQTQKQQMILILSGMIVAALIAAWRLPQGVQVGDALSLAGKLGKMEIVDTGFSWDNRYNIWTGIFASTFLFLSYFGADQSQVQRYLSGRTLTESRLGLLFNGIIKVPMQFLVLFTGLIVFILFQFEKPPLHFNEVNVAIVESAEPDQLQELETAHQRAFNAKREAVEAFVNARESGNFMAQEEAVSSMKTQAALMAEQEATFKSLLKQTEPKARERDGDYIFITFVMRYLPVGLVGLLLAVIFSAAMSSTASEINALATATVVDFYRRSWAPGRSDGHYLWASKAFTIVWGMIALFFAAVADLFDNLVEAVNIVGSVFYGSILGIFLVAFFFKQIRARAVFFAALVAEGAVVLLYFLNSSNPEVYPMTYLWLVPVGCMLVIILGYLFQMLDGGLGRGSSAPKVKP